MELKKYEDQICDIDPRIFSGDEYCFSVLQKILLSECRLTVTDKRRLVICHSCDPYPVWIWLPDDATESEIALAYGEARARFGLGAGGRFNMKHEQANKFISLARAEGITLRVSTNMLAYSAPAPIAPKRAATGEYRVATNGELDTVVSFMDAFHKDLGFDKSDLKTYRSRAERLIAESHLFLWYDGGLAVAMASYDVSGNKGRVGNVYTRPECRRRGYAASLVYAITKIIAESGNIPTLYTDADYAASNACYESIGYVKRGSLCTVE